MDQLDTTAIQYKGYYSNRLRKYKVEVIIITKKCPLNWAFRNFILEFEY